MIEPNKSHIAELLQDYVLDLLPENDKLYVTNHVSSCLECKKALDLERSIGIAVRTTIAKSVIPSKHHLRQLAPSQPINLHPWLSLRFWNKPLAVLSFLLLVLMASFTLNQGGQSDLWQNAAPTTYQTVASATNTPTQAATATIDNTTPIVDVQPTPPPIEQTSVPMPALVPIAMAPLFH